jgi:quercetin dioxygenase-like cupin family protein
MKPTAATALAAATGVLVLAGTAPRSGAQTPTPHAEGTIVLPNAVQWSPAPPSIPQGAQVAVLYGDPSKEGPFAMRLRLPANYHLPPHTHGTHEIVTVISGTFRLGHGAQADKEKARALPAGTLFAFPPGSQHYGFMDEETVVQITTTGPWTITYVNPADDPRRPR